MAKGTMLDRLAGAMKTLGKREGKSMTPRQRVAAAQRWNSLADVGETIADRMWDIDRDEFYKITDELERLGLDQLPKAPPEVAARYKDAPLADSYDINRLDNPFLSDNIDKYVEQSEFLDWCRYNKVEPNARSLKQFRWETYQTLPYRQQVWAKYKDDIIPLNMAADWVGVTDEARNARTLKETDDAYRHYDAETYPEGYPLIDEMTPYRTIDEFPDHLKPGWQY